MMLLQRRVYATLEPQPATETPIGHFIWPDQKLIYFLYINPLNTDITIRTQIDTEYQMFRIVHVYSNI